VNFWRVIPSSSPMISTLEVGLVFEVVDEGEVGFGVVEPILVIGVALQSGVFGVKDLVEVRD
jgi:hypothetical protein